MLTTCFRGHTREVNKKCDECAKISGALWRQANPNYLKEYRKRPGARERHNELENNRRKAQGPEFTRSRFEYRCKTFGITVEDFAWLLYNQNFKCPGCSGLLTLDSNTHIDHCHHTGRVRGLLCFGCNSTVGHARDSSQTLFNLSVYLDSK